MNLDEPEFQRHDASKQAAMKHALAVLAKAAENEQAGSDEVVPPLPDDLRDQWLRELARQQASAAAVPPREIVSFWKKISQFWSGPKAWLGSIATAAAAIMLGLMLLPEREQTRITRGGDEGETLSSAVALVLVGETSICDEFASLRSGEPAKRFDTREQALAGTKGDVVLVDFTTQTIIEYHEGSLQSEVDFPTSDLLDVSTVIDEILAK